MEKLNKQLAGREFSVVDPAVATTKQNSSNSLLNNPSVTWFSLLRHSCDKENCSGIFQSVAISPEAELDFLILSCSRKALFSRKRVRPEHSPEHVLRLLRPSSELNWGKIEKLNLGGEKEVGGRRGDCERQKNLNWAPVEFNGTNIYARRWCQHVPSIPLRVGSIASPMNCGREKKCSMQCWINEITFLM